MHKNNESKLVNLNVNLAEELLYDICEANNFERFKNNIN
jgi:hypothetical protein